MGIVVTDGYTYHQDTNLTVNRNSVTFSDGSVVYRLHRDRQVHVVDSHNKTLVTLRPKKLPSLHRRWEGHYTNGSNCIFSVKRSSVVGGTGFRAKVYDNPLAGKFEIEGSFEKRRFTVYDAGQSRSMVADVQVRDGNVYGLTVKAGFDTAFSVAMVVVLDEIRVSP